MIASHVLRIGVWRSWGPSLNPPQQRELAPPARELQGGRSDTLAGRPGDRAANPPELAPHTLVRELARDILSKKSEMLNSVCNMNHLHFCKRKAGYVLGEFQVRVEEYR